MEAWARDLAVLARHVKEVGFEKGTETMVEAEKIKENEIKNEHKMSKDMKKKRSYRWI